MIIIMIIAVVTLMLHSGEVESTTNTMLAQPVDLPTVSTRSIYYVSKNGTNLDGQTWDTAWNELDQIDWSVLEPGDVVYIDGGSSAMTYTTPLIIGKSGTSSAPIVIQASEQEGHNGQVIFFGGREEPLPFCGQQRYDNPPFGTLREEGIRTNDHDHIIIDGMDWQGILIHGFRSSGIYIDRGSSDITIRNVEIFNNGDAIHTSEGWMSIEPGVSLGGQNITLRRAIIHDNGQDAIQSLYGDNKIMNFKLIESWLYNGRKHPHVDESANFCTHTDGIQIFDGGDISGVTITRSVIGPGFTQGVILGQTRNQNGSWANVHDVKMRDVLFTKSADNGILGYRGSNATQWDLRRITVHCPKTKYNCIHLPNKDHTIRNSIFVGALVSFPDTINNTSGNCQWLTRGYNLGRYENPRFANVSNIDHFSLDDYTVQEGSGCTGSHLTSVTQLLNLDH